MSDEPSDEEIERIANRGEFVRGLDTPRYRRSYNAGKEAGRASLQRELDEVKAQRDAALTKLGDVQRKHDDLIIELDTASEASALLGNALLVGTGVVRIEATKRRVCVHSLAGELFVESHNETPEGCFNALRAAVRRAKGE